MNLDSLITVAGLFLAVYAVIPRVRRLEISLRFGKLGWLILFASLFLILFLQFYDTFRILGIGPDIDFDQWGMTPNKASFIVFLISSMVLVLYLRMKKLSRSNLFKFRDYIFELSRENRYQELFSLIERNIEQLAKIYKDNFFLSKLKKRLDLYSEPKSDLHSFMERFNEGNEYSSKKNKAQLTSNQSLARMLSSILPSYDKDKEASKDIVHEVLMNGSTVLAMTETRPYFALQLMNQHFEENSEFIDAYLKALMSNQNSVLYHEILNNQNMSNRCNYLLPQKNRLLHFLFSDCSVAKDFVVYRPVGEYVVSYLDKLYIQSYADPYNEPMGDFFKSGKWNSELFLGVRFLDIMISSALYQNIKTNMWLDYFPYFSNRIIRNLSPNDKLVDSSSEWPTKYHYIIYEMVSCLCNWIESVDHISLDQDNIILESILPVNENGNIPKSSMIALSQIVRDLLLSEKFTFKYKAYIMDLVYRIYFYLRMFENTKPYSDALMNCLRKADSKVGKDSSNYSKMLYETFLKFDSFKYGVELQQELDRILEDDCSQSKKY